ncbi:MAG: hypothetical protein ACRELD_05960 [Longimicrobiales bacterium]
MEQHGLMMGMFWAGVLISSVPILLSLGIGAYVLRRYLLSRSAAAEAAREEEAPRLGRST